MADLMAASTVVPTAVHWAEWSAGGSAEKKADRRAANSAALMADLKAAG